MFISWAKLRKTLETVFLSFCLVVIISCGGGGGEETGSQIAPHQELTDSKEGETSEGRGNSDSSKILFTGTLINLIWPDEYIYNEETHALHRPSNRLAATIPSYVTQVTLTISGEGMETLVLDVPLDTLDTDFAVTPGERTFTLFVETNIPGLSFTSEWTAILRPGVHGELTFSLEINAPPQNVNITVTDTSPFKNTEITISFNFNELDPDDSPTVSWSADGGTLSRSAGSRTSREESHTNTWSADRSGIYVICATVDDHHGAVVSECVTINVVNRRPVIRSFTVTQVGDSSCAGGLRNDLSCSATDPDGDPLSYFISGSSGLSTRGRTASECAPGDASTITTYTCVVNDNDGGRATAVVTATGGTLAAAPVAKKYLYVTNGGDDTISVIDGNTDTVIATLAITGSRPRNPDTSPDRRWVYFAVQNSDTVGIIDVQTNPTAISTYVNVGSGPFSVGVTKDGTEVWAVNKDSEDVSVINVASLNVVATPDVGANCGNDDPHHVAFTSTRAYVTNYNGGNVCIFDIGTRAFVAQVNTSTSKPHEIVALPDDSYVYVTRNDKIRTSDNTVTTVAGLAGGRGLAMLPDGSKIFITKETKTLTVLDTSDDSVTTSDFIKSRSPLLNATELWSVVIVDNGARGYVTDGDRTGANDGKRVYVFDPANGRQLCKSGGAEVYCDLGAGEPIVIDVGFRPRGITANY